MPPSPPAPSKIVAVQAADAWEHAQCAAAYGSRHIHSERTPDDSGRDLLAAIGAVSTATLASQLTKRLFAARGGGFNAQKQAYEAWLKESA